MNLAVTAGTRRWPGAEQPLSRAAFCSFSHSGPEHQVSGFRPQLGMRVVSVTAASGCHYCPASWQGHRPPPSPLPRPCCNCGQRRPPGKQVCTPEGPLPGLAPALWGLQSCHSRAPLHTRRLSARAARLPGICRYAFTLGLALQPAHRPPLTPRFGLATPSLLAPGPGSPRFPHNPQLPSSRGACPHLGPFAASELLIQAPPILFRAPR